MPAQYHDMAFLTLKLDVDESPFVSYVAPIEIAQMVLTAFTFATCIHPCLQGFI